MTFNVGSAHSVKPPDHLPLASPSPLSAALMLVVMTFNVGIILAVCGGFAIGALLFGHAGEPGTLAKSSGNAGALALSTSAAPLATQNTTEEMETVFVEGAGCCSGGSGYGGGGHCGGQL